MLIVNRAVFTPLLGGYLPLVAVRHDRVIKRLSLSEDENNFVRFHGRATSVEVASRIPLLPHPLKAEVSNVAGT